MARPTFDLILAALESHPMARAAEQRSGLTSAQVAAMAIQAMHDAPSQGHRDAVLREVLGCVGIVTTGEAAFARGTTQMLERMNSPEAIEREANRMSGESRATGYYVTPERIRRMHSTLDRAELQQGVSERMRQRDAKDARARGDADAPPPSQRTRADRENAADLRAAINASAGSVHGAGHASASGDGVLRLRHDISELVDRDRDRETRTSTRHLGESIGLRETLGAAFDAHAERDSQRDPLEDQQLRDASNAL